MQRFEQRDLKAAYKFAEEGGQALHLISGTFAYLRNDTPAVFKNREQIGHLIDHDPDRLWATARRLGVRVVKIERLGRVGAHVDLCGKPLARALAECQTPELNLT